MRERLQVYHVSINLLLPGSTLTVLCTYRQKKNNVFTQKNVIDMASTA